MSQTKDHQQDGRVRETRKLATNSFSKKLSSFVQSYFI
jgi:hypothetical protein